MKSLLIKSLFLSILGIGSYPGIQVANATEVPTPIYKYAVLSAGGPPHYSLLPATDLNDAIMQTEAYYLARVQGLPCNPYVETSKTGYTLESLTPISSPPGEGDGSEEIFSQIVSYTGIGGPLGICFPPYNLSQQTTRYSVINCPTGMYDDVLQQCVSSNDIDEEENLGDEEDCSIGNPINPHTGNKYQIEEDFVGTGNFALVYRRYYNSNASVISANLGRHWRGMYDKSIAETNDIAKVIRSDGKVLEYAGTNGVWDADPNIIETLDEITDAQNQRTGWQFTTSDDTVEDYDADGKLLTLTIRNSLTQSLTYNVSSANGGDDNSNTLDTVTDSFSRSLSFTYDANSRVSSMTEPNGNTYNYAYDANNNLSTVTYPDETPGNSNDNPTRIYHYEDTNFIHALTGITDETGNRFATWGYNTEGKAIFSEHAGGAERVDFIYNNDGTTLVTDSLGNSQTYHTAINFGKARTEQIDGGPCSVCGGQNQNTTFDANGFVASRTDFNGIQTTFIHDSRGLQTSRTETVGTLEERTITTEWHATFRLPIKITEQGKETNFTYDTQGRLLERNEETAL